MSGATPTAGGPVGTSTPSSTSAALFPSHLDAMARDERAKGEEERGILQFLVIRNNGARHHLEWLTALKNIYSKQLPKMPKEYICRIVYDCFEHRSLVVLKHHSVIGGICFRTFCEKEKKRFIEIVFCAITSSEQIKGYGTHLMNHLKEAMKSEEIAMFLTYADNFATGYFAKQGFTKEITAEESHWRPYIKDYEGGTLMECIIPLNIPSFLNVPTMVRRQREQVYEIIKKVSKSHVIHDGITFFVQADSFRRLNIADIAGIRETAWNPENQPSEQHIQQLHVALKKILDRVKAHPQAWPFHEPVDIKKFPAYVDIVKDPIDLSLIQKRLQSGQYYITREIFDADISRMLENCKLFNPPGNVYHDAAK